MKSKRSNKTESNNDDNNYILDYKYYKLVILSLFYLK